MAFNHLLTEFEGSPADRIFRSRGWWLKLSAAIWVGTAIILVLADRADVNALQLEITGRLPASLGSTFSVAHTFGYLNELPHALLYLVLAPLTFFLAERFVNEADSALTTLWQRGRLTVSAGLSPLNEIARLGKLRINRLLPWLLLAWWIAFNVVNETSTYRRANNHPQNHELGYVQAPFLSRWETGFNANALTTTQKWQWVVDAHLSDQLQEELKKGLQDEDPEAVPDAWLPYFRLHGNLPGTRNEFFKGSTVLHDMNYAFDLSGAVGDGLIPLSAKTEGGPKNSTQNDLWMAFLAALFIVEGAFQAFATWLVVKVVVWIIVLYRMLSPLGFHGTTIEPVFLDQMKRFGLRELHGVYNTIMWVLLVGAIMVSFSYLSNSLKGTYFFTPSGFWAYAGQLFIMTAVAIGGLAIVTGPIISYARQLERQRAAVLRDLIGKEKKASTDEERSKYIADQDLVKSQTTWPRDDREFHAVVFATLIFFTIPFVDSFHRIPAKYVQYFNALQYCQKLVELVSHWWYGIPKL